ncbi:MAG TPA: glycoside hydrolase family 3 N-terminal domain-containing protein [Bacteroidales bacterium]|nr:glycoside hydrolase family 3 N-terminal domain-containing protein [Bacteroidales bacterium]
MFYRPLILVVLLLIAAFSVAQTPDPEQHWVDSVFNSLSDEERIAQLMIVRANEPGKGYFTYIDKHVQEYNIGGVCFFRNYPHEQVKAANYWQSIAKTPMLMSIDAEWGLGMRLDSTTIFPFQMTLGAISNDELIYAMGKEIAEQCKRIGIQMNFAPVVDINSNPANPVIGMRSFGQERENVMRKGMAYMRGLQDNGVIATAKHFPGHGDTDTDSHKTLPVIPHSSERLDSIELYPFVKLIENGLGGIMIAHLYIPAYEKEEGVASTLSENIVMGLLREKLSFDGLIVTDALDMKGVTKFFKPGEIELRALMAGNDILLLPADVPKAIKRISNAVKNGEISRQLIDDRCRKVLTYKYRSGLAQYRPARVEGMHEDLNNSWAAGLSRLLYEASATLVKNDGGLLPLTHLDTLEIAYVSTGGAEGEDHFFERLSMYGRISGFSLKPDASKKELDELYSKLDDFNLLIISIRNTNIYPFKDYGIPASTWRFIRDMRKSKKIILDIFASPYAIAVLGEEDLPESVVISYQDNRISEEVGAELIFGGIPAQGHLPVGIAGLFPSGAGLATTAIRMGFTQPSLLGIADSFMARADSIALSGINMKAYPGCQVLAAKDGRIFYNKCFGTHTYEDEAEVRPMDLYDLASLTKIAATTISVMGLANDGLLDVDQRLSYYLPYLRNTDKKDIIIRELMAHQSGFRPWIPYYNYTIEKKGLAPAVYSNKISEDYNIRVAEGMYIHSDYHREIIDSIRFSSLTMEQGYKYSDLGFYLLKEAVENISNMPFQDYLEKKYYAKLGLSNMGFLPLKRFDRSRIIPTEDDQTFRKQLLWGDVHDQGAAMLGGVSGHAGLFSNAFDMAVVMQLFINGGEYGGIRFFSDDLVKEFTSTQFPLMGNRRGIGFDKPLLEYEDDGPNCRSASSDSFGHSGFTGTYAWADPRNGLVYIFLSNRICPKASNTKVMEHNIRTNLHQVFYDALENAAP